MARKRSIDIREKQRPEERLQCESSAMQEFSQAKELLKQKKYKEALKKFKFVYSQPVVLHHDWSLPESELKTLIRHYAPAERVIRKWRNDKEKLILRGISDLALLRDWRSLNSCLKESNRTEIVFYKLKRLPENEDVIESILWELWRKLAKSKKYHEIGKYLRTLAWLVFLHVSEYESQRLFPRNESHEFQQMELQRMIEEIATEDPLVYEVALGLESTEVAEHICRKILSVEASDRTYGKLIMGAVRTKHFDEAQRLYSEAREILKRYPLCKNAVRKAPKCEAHRFK